MLLRNMGKIPKERIKGNEMTASEKPESQLQRGGQVITVFLTSLIEPFFFLLTTRGKHKY